MRKYNVKTSPKEKHVQFVFAVIDGHRAVPARRGVVPHRATGPAVPCLWRARARPPAQGTAHGPFGRAVPPVEHDHFHQAVPAHSPAAKITKSLRT